jgi:hypothetical protein
VSNCSYANVCLMVAVSGDRFRRKIRVHYIWQVRQVCSRPQHSPENRLCGLVVRVPGCRPRGPGFDSRLYKIFCIAVGLERCPLSLVRINVELLE